MRRWLCCSTISLSLLAAWSGLVTATTSFYIRLRPTGAAGLYATVAFDLSHADTLAINRATLLSFTHNGTADSPEVEGGPAYGDLLSGTNPATNTTLEGQFSFNNLSIHFEALGTLTTVRLELTELAPSLPSRAPDEMSAYFVNRASGFPYPTADGLGTDALFAIDITGQPGGELGVFAPMAFIPPDTLALDGTVVGVLPDRHVSGRLKFRPLAPNPSPRYVDIKYEIPEPGGFLQIKVFDVAGRFMAAPYAGRRGVGIWTTRWDAADSKGKRVPAGVYIVQLQMAGQSLVRRVVLAR